MKKIPVFIFFSVLLVIGTAQAAVTYVPDNYPTIQLAINAMADGDTIIVRPGTHLGTVDYFGKNLEIVSELGPEFTTIDALGMGSVVRFTFGEGPGAILDGFTITNGYSPFGGGIC